MKSIEKIVVDERTVDEVLTRRILEKTKDIPHHIVQDERMEEEGENLTPAAGKHILYITNQKGEVVKSCPGTQRSYLCCGYTIINQMIQCPMDCTYCVLQGYLDHPFVILHTDILRIFEEIDELFKAQPGRFFRFGTGELSDSLALDDLTELSVEYADFFSTKRNGIIEFKTKTENVDTLLTSSTKNVVVSWSINPQKIADTEEFRCAPLEDRLRAAQRCQDKGFLLGFHFDPILWVPGWEVLYDDLIKHLFSIVDGARIAWISLGSLRYPPHLKGIARRRFPKSAIFCEEMIRGMDGKMRYPKPMRVEMYRKIFSCIKEAAPDVFVYFCMESPEVWDRVMGGHPASNEELDFRFAESLYNKFPELNMDKPEQEYYMISGEHVRQA